MKKAAVKPFLHTILLPLAMMVFVSCELVGLEYQYDYKNKPAPVKTETGMSCYEFIKQRSQLDFSLWYEAINRAEMKEFYETDSLTYFLLPDELFAGWLTANKYTMVGSVPKTILETFLKSYTVKGLFYTSKLSTTPIDIAALDGIRTIRMRLYPFSSTSSQNLHQLNAGFLASNGNVNYRTLLTSNLKMTNGVAHILSTRF